MPTEFVMLPRRRKRPAKRLAVRLDAALLLVMSVPARRPTAPSAVTTRPRPAA
jgi:hypothetical protein